MRNNLEIINEWNNTISSYHTFKFVEARELYQKIVSIDDSNLKRQHMQELIMGTLYVVSNFIKLNGLLYLNSASYDMNDIISISNEIWLNKINSGKLLEVNSFREMFDSDYYNELCSGLGITKYSISENTILDINTFIDLLMDYIKLKEKDIDFDYLKLLEFMKSDRRYAGTIHKIYYYGNNVDFCKIFDAIIKSFELEDEDLKVSKTKLDKLRYILISNGLEYLRADINNVIVEDTTDSYIDACCRKQVVDIVLNSHLDDSLKDILVKRYGIFDGRCRTLDEVAKEHGVTRERIRQKEARALRKLRLPTYVKQFRELM